jgi:hypothetical protein
VREKLDALIDRLQKNYDSDWKAVGDYLATYKDSCSEAEYARVLQSTLLGMRDAIDKTIARIREIEVGDSDQPPK